MVDADAPHVLLVEDDDGMRVLVTRILRESGYRVTGCRSGAEMWSHLPEGAVDLILLDVMLPGASGIDLLRALRAKGTVPVIMLSARNEEADRVLGLDAAVVDAVPGELVDLEQVVVTVAGERLGDLRDRALLPGQVGEDLDLWVRLAVLDLADVDDPQAVAGQRATAEVVADVGHVEGAAVVGEPHAVVVDAVLRDEASRVRRVDISSRWRRCSPSRALRTIRIR